MGEVKQGRADAPTRRRGERLRDEHDRSLRLKDHASPRLKVHTSPRLDAHTSPCLDVHSSPRLDGRACARLRVRPSLLLPFAFLLLPLLLSCGQSVSERVLWKGEETKGEEEMEKVPVVYVALGDSTGAGVGARRGGGYVARLFERIERARPGSRLVNLCMSGATTGDVLRSQVGRVGESRPTLVTLGIGINDVTRQVSPEQFAENYESIIKRIREQTDAPVVLSNVPDVSHAPAVPAFVREEARRRIRLFNERVLDIATRHRLLLVDTFEESAAVIPKHPEFFSPDGFHPSDEGYEFWAVKMWPTVKLAIGEGVSEDK